MSNQANQQQVNKDIVSAARWGVGVLAVLVLGCIGYFVLEHPDFASATPEQASANFKDFLETGIVFIAFPILALIFLSPSSKK